MFTRRRARQNYRSRHPRTYHRLHRLSWQRRPGDQQRIFSRIAGKLAGYLYNQLRHFRDGRRQNPAMAHMVVNLSDAYLKEIADHFAALNPPYPPPQTSKLAPAALERGRQLVFMAI